MGMDYSLGRVMAVSGTQMTVEADQPELGSIHVGAMVKTRSVDHEVVGADSCWCQYRSGRRENDIG